MPDRYRPHRNDNIRTEHLKCANCRTQIFLARIERGDDGAEQRVFACPHCALTRMLRIGGASDDKMPEQQAEAER